MTITQFPGEYLTEEQREQNRWINVAFCAACIAGRPAEEQRMMVKWLLHKDFANVPHEAPDPADVQAYAAFAVENLLFVLTEDPETMKDVPKIIRAGLMKVLSGEELPPGAA
jgi:hypothetical protein